MIIFFYRVFTFHYKQSFKLLVELFLFTLKTIILYYLYIGRVYNAKKNAINRKIKKEIIFPFYVRHLLLKRQKSTNHIKYDYCNFHLYILWIFKYIKLSVSPYTHTPVYSYKSTFLFTHLII